MSFKDLFTRERNVVLYGQSARFRIVKYAILIPVFRCHLLLVGDAGDTESACLSLYARCRGTFLLPLEN